MIGPQANWNWLPYYDCAWPRADFLAGVTIITLLVPEGIANAGLAVMPSQVDFYVFLSGLYTLQETRL